MRSINPVKEQSAIPKQVDRIKQWLDLLRLEYVILVDSKDGGYTFLLPIKNCPDIHIALEHNFAHITFFSNGLTCLSEESDEVVHTFLRKVLIMQSKYFTSRIVTTGSKEDLRLFLGFRFKEMNMYRFSRKVRELIQFVKEVAQLIDEHRMNEIWRDTEQEPKFPTIDISERIRFL
ncbi:MAG: hypothetical protein ACW964_07155 [Candidatus Hodarchaeales archaeon]|jgi:hypothetical protein